MLNWAEYQITQIEWLWLIPVYLLISFLTPVLKNSLLKRTQAADISNIKNEKLTLYHPFIHLLIQNNERKSKKLNSHPFLYSLIFSLLVIALAQPVKIGKRLPDPPRERDITFIVDASVSMILRDYILNGERIDRMSLLKSVLDKFIQHLQGEKMSIIVFGDSAYTLVPMTSDQLLLRRMLSRVEATMAGRFNAIGDAIALAVKQAKEEQGNSNRKRVLVLLTDADQPTGKIDPGIAAQLAKNEGLPLYTIAIGATDLAADEKRQGGLLYSPVDLSLLTHLAGITGAKNYQAGSPNALELAIEAINSHESYRREVKPVYYREPLYYIFIIAAIIIFSLSQIIHLTDFSLPAKYKRKTTSA